MTLRARIQTNHEAVAVAARDLVDLMHDRNHIVSEAHARVIVRHVVAVYLDEQRKAENAPERQYADLTKWLSDAEVGQVLTIPYQPRGSIYGRVTTAKKLTGNDQLRFATTTNEKAGTVTIRRMPDGHDLGKKDPWRSLKAVELASIPLGQSKISEHYYVDPAHRSRQYPTSNDRIQARKILEVPEADWKAATTTKGVRITRTR